MPFIGRDWRSPGEAWVKTESLGWQRMKIIESQLYSTCHQPSPACSWPPKSEYGQHMDNHCVGHHENGGTANGRLGPGEPAMRTSSLSAGSDGTSSSSSSADSSRTGSLSPSPSSSPEKNNPIHHIHPIAISSPYGWHSCRLAHRPATNCCTNKNHRHHQSTMPRSLSKQSLVSASNNSEEAQNHSPIMMMRYNRSVSDFRNAPNCHDQGHQNYETAPQKSDNNNRTKVNENGCVVLLSQPVLMKNGRRIETNDDEDDEDDLNVDIQQSSEPLDSSKQNCQINSEQPCCCCMCPSTGTGTATGSPCNFYPLKEPTGTKTAPHCRISVRTREVAMYNTISEAFYRLDFCNAIHDIRRFNYICKLLHLLITQNLTSLSGCATRVLFSMLEQVAWEVSNNKRNIHILKNLLKELRQMIEKYYCWGRPIGSSLLWQQHFETIERISQIVDGIELAPTKVDTNQAGFNDLPVEMIREILLRLNDYRDLVSSAQASPVMQIMIDNQHIWQKLCKYHFTEQQLKLALDNRSNYQQSLPSSIKQRTNNVQGIKYARTVSADGRSSYRNPVNPINKTATTTTATTAKSKKKDGGQSSVSSSSSRQKRNQVVNHPTSQNDDDRHLSSSSSSSSYVTRAIRIFDSEGSSATLGTGLMRRDELEGLQNGARQQPPQANSCSTNSSSQRRPSGSNSGPTNTKQEVSQQQASSDTNNLRSSSSGRNVDWERVFHQLRKKFDLKEEYPDCLLLCRHCRCLFWKSFGHPCIKTDERGQNPNDVANQRSALDVTAQVNNNNTDNGRPVFRGVRPSVADLSRNFDSGERRPGSGEVDVSRASNAENIRPPQADRRRNSGNNYGASDRPMLSAHLDAAQFRRAAHRPMINGQVVLREGANNNNSIQQRTSSSSARRDELIPKHVAISPQAFLKFFSL